MTLIHLLSSPHSPPATFTETMQEPKGKAIADDVAVIALRKQRLKELLKGKTRFRDAALELPHGPPMSLCEVDRHKLAEALKICYDGMKEAVAEIASQRRRLSVPGSLAVSLGTRLTAGCGALRLQAPLNFISETPPPLSKEEVSYILLMKTIWIAVAKYCREADKLCYRFAISPFLSENDRNMTSADLYRYEYEVNPGLQTLWAHRSLFLDWNVPSSISTAERRTRAPPARDPAPAPTSEFTPAPTTGITPAHTPEIFPAHASYPVLDSAPASTPRASAPTSTQLRPPQLPELLETSPGLLSPRFSPAPTSVALASAAPLSALSAPSAVTAAPQFSSAPPTADVGDSVIQGVYLPAASHDQISPRVIRLRGPIRSPIPSASSSTTAMEAPCSVPVPVPVPVKRVQSANGRFARASPQISPRPSQRSGFLSIYFSNLTSYRATPLCHQRYAGA